MTLLNINGSYFYYRTAPRYINDYYQYIVTLLKRVLEVDNLDVNLILGHHRYRFANSQKNKTLSLNINYEHTLVKEGGRSVPPGTPLGKIKYQDKHYLVRISGYKILNAADLVIDYSNPNIINVNKSGQFASFSKRHLYIAPCLYNELYTKVTNRTINHLTTFINVNEPRRKRLLLNLRAHQLRHQNINNCFEKRRLLDLYRRTKILINIHQTDHHDTFEELRVLPALQNGVIVISETSPLHTEIPYHKLVVWTDYDTIIETLKRVISDYEKYHSQLFSPENIKLLEGLDDINYQTLRDKIREQADLS